MSWPELTDEVIEEAMVRAWKAAGGPYDDRCYSFPYPPEEAHKTCTPKGRCKIGGTRRVISADTARKAWDVWLDLHTGEGRVRRWKD